MGDLLLTATHGLPQLPQNRGLPFSLAPQFVQYLAIFIHLLYHADYSVIPDRIEAGTYALAAGITKGKVDLLGGDFKKLLPTFIDTFGIDNILKDIENAQIDYIILVNNRDLSEYGGTSLNCNYIAFLNMTEEERKICSYIVYKYEKQDVAFNHNFSGYSLYKRRNR